MQDIDNVISDYIKQFDNKILGINFLEKLKYLLIDKIKTYSLLQISNESNKLYFHIYILLLSFLYLILFYELSTGFPPSSPSPGSLNFLKKLSPFFAGSAVSPFILHDILQWKPFGFEQSQAA